MVNRIQSHLDSASAVAADVMAGIVADARRAQPVWAAVSLKVRLAILRELRHRIAVKGWELASCVSVPNRTVTETLMTEVLPLVDGIKFLESYAPRILRPVRSGMAGRPMWLFGSDLRTYRDPFGVVLIVAPRNYPLLLAGAQLIQALAVGNSVVVKASPGHGGCIRRLRELARECGLDPALIGVSDGGTDQVYAAIEAGVDKVVLTGSASAGRAVLARLAQHLTPATMELSGCDAAFVLPDADLDLTARALAFGLRLNGSSTCLAPRRCFVHTAQAADLEQRLVAILKGLAATELSRASAAQMADLVAEAVGLGARVLSGCGPSVLDIDLETGGKSSTVLVAPVAIAGGSAAMRLLSADIFAPVMAIVPVADVDEAVRLNAGCAYALGASIFGSEKSARELAGRLNVGSVAVNDVIVPTADLRLTFGGRRQSGFGTTRGPEGLLDLTQPKAVVVNRTKFRLHYDPLKPNDRALFENYILAAHGPALGSRIRAAIKTVIAAARRGVVPAPNAAAGSSAGANVSEQVGN